VGGQIAKLSELVHIVDFKWVRIRQHNFFVSRPNCTISCVSQGRGCSWSLAISIFDSSLRFRDIHHQSWKLYEITPNYKRFTPSQILREWCPPKVVSRLSPPQWHVTWQDFVKYSPWLQSCCT